MGLGLDLVAMCVNDLLAQGAEPRLFLDYFFKRATGKLDVAMADGRVVAGSPRAASWPARSWPAARRAWKCRGCTKAAIMTWPASVSGR